ncbi:hypothetical protein BD560DRAFT_406502 [Blakeslea trispora]|nr:hypothetical protein BD560DRAFT_406502 [Blakeslea trispora]
MLVRHALRKNIKTISNNSRLSDFLKKTDKDTASNVYRGTLFELQTLESLSSMTGMNLDHCGGKGDGGIDLRGQWFNNINVLVQCKNTKQGCTPDQIRELMGTVLSTTSAKKKTLGILSTVSHKQFTRDVMSLFNASPVPLGLATVEETTLKSLMFNKKAQSMLKGLTISTQYDAQGNESLFIDTPTQTK